ncbi:MAG: YihY/virulence factor BrkB family protein [Sphaerochaetaceae bacterium]
MAETRQKQLKGKDLLSELRRHGKALVLFVSVCYGKYTKDRISIMASGVVYTTLISLVPFISFLVAFLSLFNVLQPFFAFITELFTAVFGTQAGGELVQLVERYSKNAGSLGVIGLVSFIFTAIQLINRVWAIVNQIYRTSPLRHTFLRRSASFITILIIGAILLGAYISVKSLLSDWMATMLGRPMFDNILIDIIRHMVPWMIAWLFIFLIIIAAPNTKVNMLSAVWGALSGTVAFALVNLVFSTLISKVLGYSVIYGSLAVVFLFLLWVYIMWVVIFVSVEVSYVHQYRPDKTSFKRPTSPAEQMANGINVMMVIGQNFKNGQGDTNIRQISEKLLMNDRELFNVLDLLVQKNFIIATNTGRTTYLPARPLDDLRIVDLVSGLYGEVYLEQNLDTVGDAIASQISEHGIKTLGNLSIYNLLERI